jgi:hypothetical protein
LDWLEAEMEATFPELRTLSPEEWGRYVNEQIFTGAAAEALARDVLALKRPLAARSHRARLRGVRRLPCGGGAGAAPRHRRLLLLGPPGIEQTLFGAPLATLRASLGLPPDPELRMFHRYLSLVPTIPDLVRPEQAVAPVAHFLRPTPFDQSGDERLPDWVPTLPARPTVYA